MARRHSPDEMEFRSDSLLDVVANIVGILIILIVVAGMRAAKAPVSAERIAEFLRSQGTSAASASPMVPAVMDAPPELKEKARSLEQSVASLDSAMQRLGAERGQIERLMAAEERRRAELAATTSAAETQKREAEEQIAALQGRLDQARKGLLQIETDIQAVRSSEPQGKVIRHKLNPLGRDVDGKELHFRLSEGKVAYVPLEELVAKVRPQLLRQRDWLMRNGSQRSSVGPVDGFRMSYLVEMQSRSIVEDIRNAGTGVRIGVSEWTILPEADLEAETAEQAVARSSAFLSRLRAAEPDTTLTFWVYPDSFALYRALQEIAHEENFTVAARPLPAGMPIAGSPNGSKSTGQ